MKIRKITAGITFTAVLAAGHLTLGSPAGLAAEAPEHVILLQHEEFAPSTIEVGLGERVRWRHEDGDDPQSVTADDGSFDSHPACASSTPASCMKGGDTFTHTFNDVGRFRYHSRTEGGSGGRGMSGIVVVTEEHDHEDD